MPPGRLDNYVPVAERVAAAAHDIQTLVSEPPAMLTETLGYIRVSIALTDGRTATGIAQFLLEGAKGAQATNPLEDAETSAVGRALAFLGYSANRGIASREDVQRAQQRQAPPARPPQDPELVGLKRELHAARQELARLSPQAFEQRPTNEQVARMNPEQLRMEIMTTQMVLRREQGPPDADDDQADWLEEEQAAAA